MYDDIPCTSLYTGFLLWKFPLHCIITDLNSVIGDNHFFYLQFDINSTQCACIINYSSNKLMLKIQEFWNQEHKTLYRIGEIAKKNKTK